MDEPLTVQHTIAGAQRLVLGVADRLGSSPAPDLVLTAFAAELEQQDALFEGIGLADLAYTIILMEAGVIPAGDGAALLSFLLKLQPRPRDFVPNPALGDLYTNREVLALGTHTCGGMAWRRPGSTRGNHDRIPHCHAMARARHDRRGRRGRPGDCRLRRAPWSTS